jgi:hypothetical protein
MPKREWQGNKGVGVMKGSEQFCCEGCAEGRGCDCGSIRVGWN